MKRLLLEFSRQDAAEVLRDQSLFTVAYEIELDSENPSIWMDEMTPLSELVSDEDIWEKIAYIFQEKPIADFFEHVGSEETIGDLFLEWIASLSTAEAHEYLIKTAWSLGLLGDNIDDDILEDVIQDVYGDGIAALIRGNADAAAAFAKMIMQNNDLRDFLNERLNMDIPQVDINNKKALGTLGGNVLLKMGGNKYRFLKGLFGDSWKGKKYLPYVIDYFDYLKEFIEMSEHLNPHTADESEMDQEKKEHVAMIHNLLLNDRVLSQLTDQISEEISDITDKPDYAFQMSGYEADTFQLPTDVESDFDSWVQEKFDEYRDDTEGTISEEVYSNLENYFDRSDFEEPRVEFDEYDIENKVAELFPTFYSKWGGELKFEKDLSITNGFEMSPETYIDSLEEAFEFLTDFYDDYNAQSDFELGDQTGLHTNVGLVDGAQEGWNYFKGFLFLNDSFATRGFEQRQNSRWSKSIRKAIMQKVASRQRFDNKSKFREAVIAAVESNFPAIESAMNDILKSTSSKDYGFSIRDNRIEFRYPGGDVDLQSMEAATLYYAYIVKLCTDSQFKRRDYLKRAVAFVLGLGDELEKADYGSFSITNDGEISESESLIAIKQAVKNNPNPEPVFEVDYTANLPGVYSGDNIYRLIKPESAGLDPTDAFTYRTKSAGTPSFITINSISEGAKSVNITIYQIKPGDIIASIASKASWGTPTQINSYYIDTYSENISLYALGAAFVKGLVKPASTEDFAKLKLFSDEERAFEQLKRVYPWLENLMKAREILESEGYDFNYTRLSIPEYEAIMAGDYSVLISRIRGEDSQHNTA